jgi:hypothetical protein
MGPMGPMGPTGETGPAGPEGPQSISGKTYRVESGFVNGNPAIAIANCAAGDTLLSGGFFWDSVGEDFDFASNYPIPNSNPSSWVTSMGGPSGSSYAVNALAICFDNP